MDSIYQELIAEVSHQIAQKFVALEPDLERRALRVDTDLAAITRQIELETNMLVRKHSLEQLIKKAKKRLHHSENYGVNLFD